VDFYLTSKDVTHGFHIDGTNVNLMAEPFVVNQAQAKFTRPGTYAVVCHEYCGAGHQAMNALVEVSASIQEGSAEGVPATTDGKVTLVSAEAPSAVHPGRKIMDAKGCIGCHSVDGAPGVGPTLKSIWGREVELSDGSSQSVDAAYIRESIVEPQKKLVKGFGPLMPKLPVTDAEIEQVTQYIQSLK
jgi:cytochrome c oxidase subunit 2